MALIKQDKILICESHSEYAVPLISTLAWNGSEYWCPYCGFHGGIFGSGVSVESTKRLEKVLALYREQSQGHLRYMGLKVCIATEYKGVRYEREEIPQECFDEAEKNSNWAYEVKVD